MANKQLPAKGRSKGKGSRYDRSVGVGIVITLVVIALVLWGPLRKFRISGEKKTTPQAMKREEPQVSHPAEKAVLIAIVIDDLGQDLTPAREVLSLPGKITCAIMPRLPQSAKIAELARRSRHEVLLHLPMEPKDRNLKTSPGTLRSNMTPMDFLTTIGDDIASVPGAVGVNNHEGSALTENKEAMKFLMAELKARELLFLDSLTSPKSVAYATAKEIGLKAAKRDVFLDNEGDNAHYISGQLEELVRIAKEHGRAIGIGHPHPATISSLRKWLATAPQQRIEIVPVSRIVN
jgi:polysaccharide deacetylase 2 family uncharacterized protein YibQ